MANKLKKPEKEKPLRPAQSQKRQPGVESAMRPAPQFENVDLKGSGRLTGRVAVITGGDSGIGRAVAIAFAREGADVAIAYLEEDGDARKTAALVRKKGRRCLVIKCDISKQARCVKLIASVIKQFGRIDILVNNAAEQHPEKSIMDITEKHLEHTFRTNIFSTFFLTAAALPHLEKSDRAAIINTTSVTAYRGSPEQLDYSASKGAVVSFTRSLAGQLAKKRSESTAWRPVRSGPLSFPRLFRPARWRASARPRPWAGRASRGNVPSAMFSWPAPIPTT